VKAKLHFKPLYLLPDRGAADFSGSGAEELIRSVS